MDRAAPHDRDAPTSQTRDSQEGTAHADGQQTRERLFRRLALVSPRSILWDEDNHVEASRSLAGLLQALLGEGQPGYASLRVPVAEGTDKSEIAATWIGGAPAKAWIDREIRSGLFPAGPLGLPVARSALPTSGLAIFFDSARLLSAWPGPSDAADEKHLKSLSELPLTFCSIRLNWVARPGALNALIQISNYWPTLEVLAPNNPAAPLPEPVTPDVAADTLEDSYWLSFESVVQALLSRFSLPTGEPTFDETRFAGPLLYVAEPVDAPGDVQDWVTGSLADAGRTLAKRALGSADYTVSGAWSTILDNVAMVSRFVRTDEGRESYHLLLPSGRHATWAEVESTAFSFAFLLAATDFVVTFHVISALVLVADHKYLWPVWRGLMPQALDLAGRLQSQAVVENGTNEGTLRKIQRLQLAVSRLGLALMPVDELIRAQEGDVGRIRDLLEDLNSWLAMEVSGVPPLRTDDLTTLPMATEAVHHGAENLGVLRQSYAAVERTVEGAMAAGRQGGALIEAASQRRLTYTVAFLAALAVTPLLLGHDTSLDIQAALAHLPHPFSATASLLEFIHPWLALLAIVAVVAMSILVGREILRASGRWTRKRDIHALAPEIRTAAVWRNIRAATEARSRNADASTAILDRASATDFLDAWDQWRAESVGNQIQSEIDVLPFAMTVELTLRPRMPILLPRTLVVIHKRLVQLWGSRVMEDASVRASLETIGLSPAIAQKLLETAQLSQSTGKQLVAELDAVLEAIES